MTNVMTKEQFATELEYMSMSQRSAAKALGKCRTTIQNYLRGKDLYGKDTPIPEAVRLAMITLRAQFEEEQSKKK